MLPMILGVVVQYVDGNQRIIHVSELFSDHEDFITSSEDDNSLTCCVYGNCSCSSLDHALANLTSNVLINITTDVTLSSLVTVSGLENVSIIGHNNPTVNCESVGGINITFCNNCIVQGITWDRCGAGSISNDTEPGLKLSYSSNVTIQSCFFQQSVGQAVVLSEMLGDVSINNCMFMNNSYYRGHGAAVHYSSSANNTINYSLAIKNCNFSYNKIKSLVYLENKYSKIILNNSTFNYNQGISVYATNQKIYLDGKVLFENNTAENGAGIYISDHSTVIFVNNSEVKFIQNSAKHRGAVFLRNHSSIIFDQNSVVSFINNSATNGIVYSDAWSNVTFKGNCNVIFSGNSATQRGAAIYSDNSLITFTGNSNVIFSSNYVSIDDERSYAYYPDYSHYPDYPDHPYYPYDKHKHDHGGIIYSINFSNISFKGSSTTLFKNNTAYDGGAIYSSDYGSISFKGNCNVTFNSNSVTQRGAAIYSDSSLVTFTRNSNVTFSSNYVFTNHEWSYAYYPYYPYDQYHHHGGIIYSINFSNISFKGSSTTLFHNNTAYNGGAIYSSDYGSISFKGNCDVTFSGNSAMQWGATIYSDSSLVTFMGNSNVTFSSNYDNERSYYPYDGVIYSTNFSNISFEGSSTTLFNNNTAYNGGGIYSSDYSSISFEGNSNTIFSNNYVDSEGGAIYYKNFGSISFKGNASTMFSNNTADYYAGAIELFTHVNMFFSENSATTFIDNNSKYGGAIDCYYDCSILHEGNSTAMFNGNDADYGGAIFLYYSSITFEGISNTVFNNNTVTADGGAIDSDKYSTISFNESSTVEFSDNMANHGGSVFSTGDISFNGNPYTEFRDNTANNNGGAMFLHANLTLNNNSTVNFTNNKAKIGATIFSIGESNKIIEIGSPTIIFNDHEVNWCTNICLPYNDSVNRNHRFGKDGEIDGDVVITIDSNGTVKCSNEQKAFVSFNRKCGYKYLEDILVKLKSNELATISGEVIIFSVISLTKLNNVSIIGSKNHSLICINNYNAGLQVKDCSNITIEGLNWAECGADTTPVINILNATDITLQDCLFQKSKGPVVMIFESSGDVNINHCQFINNTEYSGHGAAVHYSSDTKSSQTTFLIFNCNFTHNDAASLVYINGQTEDTNISLYNSSFHNNHGISVYLSSNTLHINGEVLFENNVAQNGAGIYVNDFSKVIFNKNSSVKFNNNSAYRSGAAISLNDHSSVLFDQNSVVTFSSNSATQYGSAIYLSNNSQVSFMGNSNIEVNNNIATKFGGSIYSEHHSSVSFEENSTVAFHENIGYNGGAIISRYNSIIIFEDNSMVLFNNNEAYKSGGAIFSNNGTVTIKGNSTVTFNNNTALNGGAMYCEHLHSDTFFEENSIVTYSGNGGNETVDGGAVYLSMVSIFEFAIVTFNNNTAQSHGGAVHCEHNQIFLLGGNSTVTFSGNKAMDGGAIHALNMCKIIFKENSNSLFHNNLAINNGSIILSREYSDISFMGKSKAIFNNNAADNGGIFYLDNYITLTFNDSAVITFTDNNARQHGGVFYFLTSFVLFNGNSTISFANNEAKVNGGVMYCDSNSNITFTGFTNVTFNENKAIDGGVLSANNNSKIMFEGNVSVTFIKNEARSNGGVGYFNGHCSVTLKQNCNVTFENNNAILGGALCINSNTNITFTDNSTSLLKDNKATNDGGAINIQTNSSIMVKNNATLTFNTNNALYGGAMFFDVTNTTIQVYNNKNISFMSNTARIAGDDIYIDLTGSSGSCVNNRIIGEIQYGIATPPNKLEFYDPAICTDNDTEECNTYYLEHIMLGEEINIPVCISNYCDQPSYSIRFLLLEENNQNYSISGTKQVLLSCNETFQGITIIGNILSKPLNYTINLTLHDDLNPRWKQISVNLTVELTPCHPGFWQYSESEKCECYNASDIVFCSGSSSTIKRGYWFGSVTGKPTVTFCPINYCNFTCCEASNGYYQLSPVRDNQCRSHRSGTACGNCTDGYTLSFDSPECVNVDSCTAGQTVLVILLTVTYWIVMVTLVFAMMYYKVPIGYLYSITYYYSIMDILLSENLQASKGLYLTVSIISSFSKITPQFLGELCLTTEMSGIDQQFIHYIHPTAVIMILAIISLSARSSRRISASISRGIIHVICLLLLLSYTSIASTSLLLMRSLTFHGIDKIYTYLSPDIEYFHGRHLAYGIVALLCTITIAVGLPLLLILEPYLNHKINFAKIKPLLDQFQGCYKDKFRCFAGYYMMCRLVIITIVIVNSSNGFVANYLLIVVCGVIALIHVTAKPYNNKIINKFDGMILQLIIFITALPLLDDFDSPLATSIDFVLVLLPLLTLTAITLFLHKDDIKNIAKYFTFKDRESTNGNSDNIVIQNKEIPMKEFDFIVDDRARNNSTTSVTVCDM